MKARGFTLVELVVAIAISSIVVVFAAMFIGAPLGAYEAHSRRAVLVADTSGAWPRMEKDLREALPNSLRARRNGNFVVIEMLPVLAVARYLPPISGSFVASGVSAATAAPPYLSVNPGADVYTLAGSTVSIATWNVALTATVGEFQVTVVPAPAPAADSPKGRIFLVGPPITYLCDESLGQGTLRRYANYTVAANQTAHDTPGELTGAGVSNDLVTQGLTSCAFEVLPVAANQLQAASVRLTTTRSGDSVTLLHISRGEYVP
ncbi:MAG TPA: prepilin-type N-terminal cleavage/methylation domain-containing protein [Steroidobacteraceae bacterium]|jgi:MSHA biogenesis protein MshO|nr:prepilin-type N-terminal cleavage/methylation domain-containing protein [Steroidobacteraceae bacterium]